METQNVQHNSSRLIITFNIHLRSALQLLRKVTTVFLNIQCIREQHLFSAALRLCLNRCHYYLLHYYSCQSCDNEKRRENEKTIRRAWKRCETSVLPNDFNYFIKPSNILFFWLGTNGYLVSKPEDKEKSSTTKGAFSVRCINKRWVGKLPSSYVSTNQCTAPLFLTAASKLAEHMMKKKKKNVHCLKRKILSKYIKRIVHEHKRISPFK